MKIIWLGQAAFKIESQKSILVTDPYNRALGKLPKDLAANVVTVSHAHMDHNFTKGVTGNPEIINSVGSFKVGDFKITGVATFHDNVGGKKRGNNVVYTIEAEGLRLCHLGDLGHVLSDDQLKTIGAIDVLMIPVGGFFTIGPSEAVSVVNQLKPKIVLPMHYKLKRSLVPLPIVGVDKFVDALGWAVEEVDELNVTSDIVNSTKNKVVVFKK